MGDFGSSFVGAFTAVRALRDRERATDIAERADTRAAETHQQEMADHAHFIETNRKLQDVMAEAQKVLFPTELPPTGPPPAQGLQPPPGVGAPPPGAAPPMPPPGTAPAGPPPGPMAGPPPGTAPAGPAPAPAAPPPDTYSGPVRSAIPTAPPGGPAPGPSTAPTPAPPPAGGMLPPSVPGGRKMDLQEEIDKGRIMTNKMLPLLVDMVSKANPAKAAEYAQMMLSGASQDRMAKTVAMASMMWNDPTNPAINKLLPDVMPDAEPGSWTPGKPDPQGNVGYGSIIRNINGQRVAVPVHPPLIKSMLQTTLSAPVWLGEMQKEAEEARKGKETDANIANQQEARKISREQLEEVIRAHKAEEPVRAAMAQSHLASAGLANESRRGMIEDRKENTQRKGEQAALSTFLQFNGISPATLATMDDDAKTKLSNHFSHVKELMDDNKMSMTSPAAVAAADAAAKKIALGQNIVQRDGKFYYNTGDPKTSLLIRTLPENLTPHKSPAGLQKPAP